MGFWGGVKNLVAGKPVFEEPAQKEQTNEPLGPAGQTGPQLVDSSGHKIIPELLLEHCESHIDDSEMEVTVWMTNRSAVEVELDKIVMLGTTMELDRFLAPNEAREIRIYEGKVQTDDSYDKANLFYKQRINGDYFQADFEIEYDYDSRGLYKVEELHPIRPVRDV